MLLHGVYRQKPLALLVGASSSRRGKGWLMTSEYPTLALLVGASSSRLRVRPRRASRNNPRPPRGGEFIEAQVGTITAISSMWSPRPPRGGEFIEASWALISIGSPSWPSPSSWGRVHRGDAFLAVNAYHLWNPRPPRGGEFIEARTATTIGRGRSRPRPPRGGEFIEAARVSRLPLALHPLALLVGASSSRLTWAGHVLRDEHPRPPRGGEFIEAWRRPPAPSPTRASLALLVGASSSRHSCRAASREAPRALALLVGASSSRRGDFRDRGYRGMPSPSSWGRVHRGRSRSTFRG